MGRKNKIAIIAPPFTTVPPKGQGGTERIIDQMITGLVKRKYKVTLFGAGKSLTSAKFIQIFKNTISEQKFNPAHIEASRPLRLETAYMTRIASELIKRDKEFNIIFNHMRGGYLLLPLGQYLKTPMVNIPHLPIFKEMAKAISLYKNANIITISNDQRRGAPKIKYLATIYNGVDLTEFEFCSKPKNYLLFMGALGEHKNPKEAILAAKKTNSNLILAGGKKREPYFSKEIKPLIDGKKTKYVSEVSKEKRLNLLKYAKAFLFPIKWKEPFGLVTIEAMASGTPVIAYPNGATKEVIKDRETGFIVKNVNEMAKAIKKINKVDRYKCRERVEKYFSTEKMVDGYEKIIKKLT